MYNATSLLYRSWVLDIQVSVMAHLCVCFHGGRIYGMSCLVGGSLPYTFWLTLSLESTRVIALRISNQTGQPGPLWFWGCSAESFSRGTAAAARNAHHLISASVPPGREDRGSCSPDLSVPPAEHGDTSQRTTEKTKQTKR